MCVNYNQIVTFVHVTDLFLPVLLVTPQLDVSGPWYAGRQSKWIALESRSTEYAQCGSSRVNSDSTSECGAGMWLPRQWPVPSLPGLKDPLMCGGHLVESSEVAGGILFWLSNLILLIPFSMAQFT